MNGEADPFSTLNSDNGDSVPTEWLRRALLTERVPKAFNSSAFGHCSTWRVPELGNLSESFLTTPLLRDVGNDWADESLLPRNDYMRPAQQLSIAEVARAQYLDDVACSNRALMDLTVSVMKHLVERLSLWIE